jgi:predicted secreted hydrolase
MKGALVLAWVLACGGLAASGQNAAGWRNAEPGRILHFPADHASHPDYRLEWWYYTGNVRSSDGRPFGYQLTFFRIGVDPAPVNPSRWTVRDLFMAHLAITDIRGQQHRATERLSRAGVGWAGASTDAYRVWLDDWRVESIDGRHHLTAASSTPGLALDLVLEENRPPVLHGDRAYSRKGSQAGNASHYYSLTRLPTRGTLAIGGKRFEVAGASWMDHEFGSSFLEPPQTGWDWLSLQLDDGTDMMLYRLRASDGSIDPHSSGTVVAPGGALTRLDAGGFTLTPGRRWSSPASGAAYPVEWRIAAPGDSLDVVVKAAVDAQEMHAGLQSGIAYWEGAVVVTGTRKGRPVTGVGYLEMTGYSGRTIREFLGGVRP